jgi:hypothetical protein
MVGLDMLKFNTNDINRFIRALTRVSKQVRRSRQAVPREMAIKFTNTVLTNITSQKFVHTWSSRAQRYNPKYQIWKRRYGKGGGFWVLWGDLISSITYFKAGDGWMSGVPSGAMDSGGKSWFGKGDQGEPKPLAMIARLLEKGGNAGRGGKHPKRPVFGPTLVEFRTDGARETGRKYLRTTIRGAWR